MFCLLEVFRFNSLRHNKTLSPITQPVTVKEKRSPLPPLSVPNTGHGGL